MNKVKYNLHELSNDVKTLPTMDASFLKLVESFKLSEKDITNNYTSLEDTVMELKNCKNCKRLEECKNHLKGYVYYPQKKESRVCFTYVPCKHLKNFENKLNDKKNDNLLNNARMKDIDITDKNRVQLIKWLKKFYDDYDITKDNKGLYLHGSFGSGKTFLIAALLNELKISKGVKYEIAYWPEVLRNLKDDFSNLDSKVRYYSSVEILLIDDIGAEKVTDWGRDEILGSILQCRMNDNLTTFFTSNLTIDELEKHLSIAKGTVDMVKSRRIIERIKQLTIDMELIAENKRK